MVYQSISLDVTDGLARLTLTQPAAGNPFNAEFCRDICQASNELAGRKDLRAVLITAQGKFFSVGGDIGMFMKMLDTLPDAIRDWTSTLHMGIARLQRLDAPIIAAVHATCMGGGVSMVAGCDLVVAGKSARFGAAYPQIGYSFDAGASTALTSRMSIARARRFMLFNEMLTAEAAADIGLVDHLVDDDQLLAEAERMAVQLSQGPTRAYGEMRRILNKALRQPLEAQLEDEAQALAKVAGSLDAREGITAFVEKRKPRFQGQ
ncbi:enoyl-CoA hydratase/isomerase family protein [Polycyclovorans algicola]|jgi:2-(1,2-epoxy-1,2-dihydrophenyl)acetyl-CoA isomerase|uniref:enoyl-CoA hydratase/isomerase family protein n=1 Tax=Polycyclovorans algicola TaxID=616992 RepID=UPI0004A71BC3|nr:enoyl-CoA hydratase-related protein [Polycyclovorans algicola]